MKKKNIYQENKSHTNCDKSAWPSKIQNKSIEDQYLYKYSLILWTLFFSGDFDSYGLFSSDLSKSTFSLNKKSM